jgi:hypothetical protein
MLSRETGSWAPGYSKPSQRNSGRETQLGLIVLHPIFYEEGKALYQRQQAKLPLLK